mgnify:CR=1 FL=1
MKDQNHPLYSIDRDHIDRLLAKEVPDDGDIVDLARLLLRYEGFPGASDLQHDMERTLESWRMTKEILNVRARKIWADGFRPGRTIDDEVGSGFDTKDSEKG